MGMLGLVRCRTARKQHNCYLCTVEIRPGEKYLTWIWKYQFDLLRMNAHEACEAYAQCHLSDWTGAGVEPGAVEYHLRESLLRWHDYSVIGVDAAVESSMLKDWPELRPLISMVAKNIRDEYEDSEPPHDLR